MMICTNLREPHVKSQVILLKNETQCSSSSTWSLTKQYVQVQLLYVNNSLEVIEKKIHFDKRCFITLKPWKDNVLSVTISAAVYYRPINKQFISQERNKMIRTSFV